MLGAKVPNVDNPFKVIDLVKGERVARIAATKCAFIEALNYTMCIMQVPDKSRKVVKRVKHSNSTAASSNTTTRVAQNATMRTSSASNKTKATPPAIEAKKASSSPPSSFASSSSLPLSSPPNSMDSIFKLLTDRMKNMEIDISIFKKYLEGLNEQYSAAFNAVNKDVKTKLDSAEKKIGLGIEKAELLLATVSDTSRAQGTEVESLISTLYEDLPRFKAEMESIRSAIISARESQMEELKLVLKTAEDVLGMRSNLTVLSIHVAELQQSVMNGIIIAIIFGVAVCLVIAAALFAWIASRE